MSEYVLPVDVEFGGSIPDTDESDPRYIRWWNTVRSYIHRLPLPQRRRLLPIATAFTIASIIMSASVSAQDTVGQYGCTKEQYTEMWDETARYTQNVFADFDQREAQGEHGDVVFGALLPRWQQTLASGDQSAIEEYRSNKEYIISHIQWIEELPQSDELNQNHTPNGSILARESAPRYLQEFVALSLLELGDTNARDVISALSMGHGLAVEELDALMEEVYPADAFPDVPHEFFNTTVYVDTQGNPIEIDPDRLTVRFFQGAHWPALYGTGGHFNPVNGMLSFDLYWLLRNPWMVIHEGIHGVDALSYRNDVVRLNSVMIDGCTPGMGRCSATGDLNLVLRAITQGDHDGLVQYFWAYGAESLSEALAVFGELWVRSQSAALRNQCDAPVDEIDPDGSIRDVINRSINR